MKKITKDPTLAGVLSFLCPGLGQIYCGEIGRGLLFLFGTAIGYCFFILPGIIVYIISIYDAIKLAKENNK